MHTTDTTYIRNWELTDAHDLAAALNNPRIHDNLRDGLPMPYTPGDAAEFIRSVLYATPGSQYAWAVQWQGRAVGSVGLYRGGNIHRRTAELGYYLAEPCWGRGLMTGAVREACRLVFATTDIVRIYAEPFAHNIASCRVLEKSGFTCEGTLRQNAEKNGRLLDMKMYALLKQGTEA